LSALVRGLPWFAIAKAPEAGTMIAVSALDGSQSRPNYDPSRAQTA